jgi:hypothetical protein
MIARVTTAADYDARAQQHKPKSHEGMADAVKTLREQGLTPRDIADALRLNVAEVIGLEKMP